MDTKYFTKNLSIIERQRNFFLLISIVSIFSNFLLTIKTYVSTEKIIMVPPLKKDMWVSTDSVSGSYIEEMSNLFLSHFLDISPNNIAYKKSLIMQHIDQSDPTSVEEINKYFLELEEKYKKFDLTTYFTTKNLVIDPEKLVVKVSGLLTSYYGKKGSDFTEESYFLSFKYKFGRLMLKQFKKAAQDEK